ncbi:hypothetical protein QF044_001458 [Chryseobacterium sp. W4I1]|nr:hypothetical protein [Chryseobacterium sp. W4I1]
MVYTASFAGSNFYLFLIKCVTRSLNSFTIFTLHIYECNFNKFLKYKARVKIKKIMKIII